MLLLGISPTKKGKKIDQEMYGGGDYIILIITYPLNPISLPLFIQTTQQY